MCWPQATKQLPVPGWVVGKQAGRRSACSWGGEVGRGGLYLLTDLPGCLLQIPEDKWYEAEKVWLVQKDGFTLGNGGRAWAQEWGGGLISSSCTCCGCCCCCWGPGTGWEGSVCLKGS